MNQEQIAGILDELAARFGATGAELWNQLVAYEVAVAWYAIFAPLVIILGGAVLWRVGIVRDEENLFFPGALLTMIGAIALLISWSYAIPALAAPQAAALKALF